MVAKNNDTQQKHTQKEESSSLGTIKSKLPGVSNVYGTSLLFSSLLMSTSHHNTGGVFPVFSLFSILSSSFSVDASPKNVSDLILMVLVRLRSNYA